MKINNYVVGFAFTERQPDSCYKYLSVLLIEKKRPSWQKGYLNGIGGKIYKNESPNLAMIREFRQEAGQFLTDWKYFLTLNRMIGDDYNTVYCYYIINNKVDKEIIYEQKTDEKLVELHIADDKGNIDFTFLNSFNVMPSLFWLIPMALSMEDEFRITKTTFFKTMDSNMHSLLNGMMI